MFYILLYRCQIPECGETGKDFNYDPHWVLNAVPATSSGFSSCERFTPTGLENGSLLSCPASLFDRPNTVACDGFVYARDNSVVYDVSA